MWKIFSFVVALCILSGSACAAPGIVKDATALDVQEIPHAAEAIQKASKRVPSPDTVLGKALGAFKLTKSFRVHETLDPVSGAPATFVIEVAAPDNERWISRGECANNLLGENVRLGSVAYQRCGRAPWIKNRNLNKTVRESYIDYLRYSAGYAINGREFENLWVIKAEYRGADGPPGTMTWWVSREDYLPRKFSYMTGYSLVSEFYDFDNPAIIVRAPE